MGGYEARLHPLAGACRGRPGWISPAVRDAWRPRRVTALAGSAAGSAGGAACRASGHSAVTPAPDPALLKTYCVGCHSDRGKAGGLSLASFDPSKAADNPETAEKIVRKLNAGMMPPAGMKRPDRAATLTFVHGIEARLDQAAAARPNPGWRPFQRLTRVEYANAVKNLLDLDIDPTLYLPPDTSSHGFDNVADAQSFSPTLFEGYLRAASQISRLAVGDRGATATSATYRIPQFESQMRHVEGTPFGARGGLSVVHTFPADGSYVFQVILVRTVSGELYGNTAIALASSNEPVEILVNGERAALLEVHAGHERLRREGDDRLEPAGAHQGRTAADRGRLSAAFLRARWTI